MKVTTCINMRRFSILAILFLLSTAVLTAQIKIKERVEIAPTNTKRLKARTSSSYQPGTLLIDSDVQGLIYNGMSQIKVERIIRVTPAFLCICKLKRLDKCIDILYIPVNRLPNKSSLFKSSVRCPYLSTITRRGMSSIKFPSIFFSLLNEFS
jgi:hypothetical protein